MSISSDLFIGHQLFIQKVMFTTYLCWTTTSWKRLNRVNTENFIGTLGTIIFSHRFHRQKVINLLNVFKHSYYTLNTVKFSCTSVISELLKFPLHINKSKLFEAHLTSVIIVTFFAG